MSPTRLCVLEEAHTCIISELRPLQKSVSVVTQIVYDVSCALEVDLPMRAPTLCVAGV